MTLGRLIYFLMPSHKVFLKGQSVTKYFVWADIVSFLVQGAGGSMLSPGSSPETQRNGLHIYMGGIGLQEFFILIFSLLAISLHRKVLAMERAGTLRDDARGWRSVMYALYAVLLLITVGLHPSQETVICQILK
jgi:predicted ABC-type exoprotein transport system permease subunit